MKGDPVHFAVRGLFETQAIPACGRWSQRVTFKAGEVRCPDCKATLDYAMAGGAR